MAQQLTPAAAEQVADRLEETAAGLLTAANQARRDAGLIRPE